MTYSIDSDHNPTVILFGVSTFGQNKEVSFTLHTGSIVAVHLLSCESPDEAVLWPHTENHC